MSLQRYYKKCTYARKASVFFKKDRFLSICNTILLLIGSLLTDEQVGSCYKRYQPIFEKYERSGVWSAFRERSFGGIAKSNRLSVARKQLSFQQGGVRRYCCSFNTRTLARILQGAAFCDWQQGSRKFQICGKRRNCGRQMPQAAVNATSTFRRRGGLVAHEVGVLKITTIISSDVTIKKSKSVGLRPSSKLSLTSSPHKAFFKLQLSILQSW